MITTQKITEPGGKVLSVALNIALYANDPSEDPEGADCAVYMGITSTGQRGRKASQSVEAVTTLSQFLQGLEAMCTKMLPRGSDSMRWFENELKAQQSECVPGCDPGDCNCHWRSPR